MNIFLIPYTWMRHFSVAFVCASAGLLSWWIVLSLMVLVPFWSVDWDGAAYLVAMVAGVAGASTLCEASLRRRALWRRSLLTVASASISGVLCLMGYFGWHKLFGPLILSDEAGLDLGEATLVSLKYRLPVYMFAGMVASVGPVILRKGAGFFSHVGGGLAAGMLAAGAWYALGYPKSLFELSDQYVASAAGSLVFGAAFGLLAWGIPDDLYAGWIRVVSETRHGRRIPVDALDGSPRERFVGHFPRGLDLFLPAEDAVMELHFSVMVNRRKEYRGRGLTLQPTLVRRFLERIDLR